MAVGKVLENIGKGSMELQHAEEGGRTAVRAETEEGQIEEGQIEEGRGSPPSSNPPDDIGGGEARLAGCSVSV